MKKGTLLILIIIAIIICISFQPPAWGANKQYLDSLKTALAKEIADTLKLNILKKLISNSDCEDTLTKLKLLNGYDLLAKKTRNEDHILYAQYYLGDYFWDCKKDIKTALKCYEACAMHANDKGNKDIAVMAFNAIAQVYEYNAENILALENYYKAINLKPSSTSSQSIYENMGGVYKLTGDYTRALDCYEKAYSIQYQRMMGAGVKQQQDTLGLMLLLINIANVHIFMNQYSKALETYRHVQELNMQIQNKWMDMYSFAGIGDCSQVDKDLITAADYYNKALQKSIEIKDDGEQAHLMNCLVEIYLLQNNIQKARQYAEQARAIELSENRDKQGTALSYLPHTYALLADISKKRNDLNNALRYINKAIVLYRLAARLDVESSETWNTLSDIYGQMHKPIAALTAYKHYISLRDSVFSQEKVKEITRIEMNGEFGRKQMADSLQQAKKDILAKAELQKQKRDKYFFIAGSILLLFIAVGSVYFLVYTRRAKKRIELLMREMHHRVKNNLQVISTLLNLQLADVLDESARRSIEEGITRISSIALIHHHLYRVDDLSSIEFSDFAKELLKQVSAIYSKPGQQLQQTFEIPSTLLDIDTAIPLGLMLNELMTNSFKYAYNTVSDCKMSIKLFYQAGNYTIQYYDYGPGLPDSFNIETAESLGMRIIQNLSAQLGGYFHYSKTNNCFALTFKDTTLRKRVA